MRAREVEQPPDYALVLRAMFPGLTLEELDASLAQCDGDFGALSGRAACRKSQPSLTKAEPLVAPVMLSGCGVWGGWRGRQPTVASRAMAISHNSTRRFISASTPIPPGTLFDSFALLLPLPHLLLTDLFSTDRPVTGVPEAV